MNMQVSVTTKLSLYQYIATDTHTKHTPNSHSTRHG